MTLQKGVTITSSISNIIESFRQNAAETRRVLVPDNPIIGKLSRCGVDGKERGKDGAYILFLDGFPSGGFQNFRDGHGW